MSDQTILASDLRVITRYLKSLGKDPAPVLTAVGIDTSVLSEPRSRVPAQQVEALLTQLVAQFPDRNLGLALANHHHMTDTHVLGLTAIASGTGLDALRRLVRYQALVSTQEPFTITEDAETVTLSKKAVHGDTAEHLIQVFIFAVILTAIRNISGFTGDLTGIAFTGKPQGPEADYRQHFGPRITFSSGDACMTIPRAVLEQPISTSNVDILTANEPLLASLVRAVRENNLPREDQTRDPRQLARSHSDGRRSRCVAKHEPANLSAPAGGRGHAIQSTARSDPHRTSRESARRPGLHLV